MDKDDEKEGECDSAACVSAAACPLRRLVAPHSAPTVQEDTGDNDDELEVEAPALAHTHTHTHTDTHTTDCLVNNPAWC